jgi:putative transposase
MQIYGRRRGGWGRASVASPQPNGRIFTTRHPPRFSLTVTVIVTMPVRHRVNINEPFHAHELTFSCYRRFPFLKATRTCEWLAEAINDARERWGFSLLAYVFMPDHVHLIIWPQQPNYDIAKIRQAIKAPGRRKAIAYLERHAPEWLPRITRQRGKNTERLFWQSGGGYDRNVYSAATLMAMIDYIHANPVR